VTPAQSASLVSIVLCTYNQREFLAQSVESALDQTDARIELIVIDNGSTDDTAELLQRYARLPNVQLFRHRENRHLTTRLNEGIRASTGEFISILYGDDYYLPDKTARQLARFAALTPSFGVVHSPGYRLNAYSGERWVEPVPRAEGRILEDLLRGYHRQFINPISPLVRRECLERYPFHETVFGLGEGHFLFVAMRYLFSYLDDPLVVMREHHGNAGKAYRRNVQEGFILLGELEREAEFPSQLRHHLDTIRAVELRNLGWKSIRLLSEPRDARRDVAQALRYQKRQILHPRTLLTFALSFLPSGALVRVNRLINRVRRPRVSLDFRGGYS